MVRHHHLGVVELALHRVGRTGHHEVGMFCRSRERYRCRGGIVIPHGYKEDIRLICVARRAERHALRQLEYAIATRGTAQSAIVDMCLSERSEERRGGKEA